MNQNIRLAIGAQGLISSCGSDASVISYPEGS